MSDNEIVEILFSDNLESFHWWMRTAGYYLCHSGRIDSFAINEALKHFMMIE